MYRYKSYAYPDPHNKAEKENVLTILEILNFELRSKLYAWIRICFSNAELDVATLHVDPQPWLHFLENLMRIYTQRHND